MNDLTRLPPHDQDAEEAVNGSLLIDGGCYAEVINFITPDDFLSEPNSRIFAACTNLYNRDVSISTITVRQELEVMGWEEKIGGAGYLNHLVSVVPTSMDIRFYAEIVKRLSVYRRMITVGEKVEALGYDPQPDVNQALDQADELILSLRKRANYTTIVTPRMRSEDMLKRYDGLAHSETPIAVRTGFSRLDRHLGGGFYNGELWVVAGRAGMGKTTILSQFANSQAKTANVLYCSAEMKVSSLTDRDVATQLGVHIHEIRAGHYTEELYGRIIGLAIPAIDESNVFYLESKRGAPLTTSRIMSAAIEMQMRYGLTAVYVDYLGLLEDSYGSNQNERLGHISKNLKNIAMELDIPTIVVHQLSRAIMNREDKEPQLSDLYESGHIEQDADGIIFIHRNNYYDRESVDKTGKLIIAKERQGGKTGFVPMYYEEQHSRYFESETSYA